MRLIRNHSFKDAAPVSSHLPEIPAHPSNAMTPLWRKIKGTLFQGTRARKNSRERAYVCVYIYYIHTRFFRIPFEDRYVSTPRTET